MFLLQPLQGRYLKQIHKLTYLNLEHKHPDPPYFLFLFILGISSYFRLLLPRRVRKEVQLVLNWIKTAYLDNSVYIKSSNSNGTLLYIM